MEKRSTRVTNMILITIDDGFMRNISVTLRSFESTLRKPFTVWHWKRDHASASNFYCISITTFLTRFSQSFDETPYPGTNTRP